MQSHCLPIGTGGHEPTLVNEITCQTLWGYFLKTLARGIRILIAFSLFEDAILKPVDLLHKWLAYLQSFVTSMSISLSSPGISIKASNW